MLINNNTGNIWENRGCSISRDWNRSFAKKYSYFENNPEQLFYYKLILCWIPVIYSKKGFLRVPVVLPLLRHTTKKTYIHRELAELQPASYYQPFFMTFDLQLHCGVVHQHLVAERTYMFWAAYSNISQKMGLRQVERGSFPHFLPNFSPSYSKFCRIFDALWKIINNKIGKKASFNSSHKPKPLGNLSNRSITN